MSYCNQCNSNPATRRIVLPATSIVVCEGCIEKATTILANTYPQTPVKIVQLTRREKTKGTYALDIDLYDEA